ncbi:Uncharacterised protein [Vibrio cholerae]|uniref:Uncharacterized protein n=1 Tax=Vibrio cholerae TaxID=666 RepID=A0A656AQW1_VIBCL|nr:Uncharacterised protein [Vibrio cholerae]CSD28150.1 Uncharacterised protein [Vibrio cholerae]CSI60247.1 Uncharacterised protein [Vibrio cholerae]
MRVLRSFNRITQFLQQQTAIGEACEAVIISQLIEFRFCQLFAFPHRLKRRRELTEFIVMSKTKRQR